MYYICINNIYDFIFFFLLFLTGPGWLKVAAWQSPPRASPSASPASQYFIMRRGENMKVQSSLHVER